MRGTGFSGRSNTLPAGQIIRSRSARCEGGTEQLRQGLGFGGDFLQPCLRMPQFPTERVRQPAGEILRFPQILPVHRPRSRKRQRQGYPLKMSHR